MSKVILESPYAGDVERNIEYAKLCMKHSLTMGEAPLLSHLLYTQVLDDTIPIEPLLKSLGYFYYIVVMLITQE